MRVLMVIDKRVNVPLSPLHFNKFFKRKVKPETSLDVCIFAKEKSDCQTLC